MERKEMHSHTFKFRAFKLLRSCRALSLPHLIYDLFSDWLVWNTFEQLLPEEPNHSVLFQRWELNLLMQKSHECSSSPAATPAVEADRKWRMFGIYPVLSLEMCVFLHLCIGLCTWIKGTLSLIYFVEHMCEQTASAFVFLRFFFFFFNLSFPSPHCVILRKIWAQENVWAIK